MLALLPLFTAHAATYDAFKNFHAVGNPATGTWVYGYMDASLAFTKYGTKTTTTDGLKVWSKGTTLKPGVRKNPTGADVTVSNVTYPKFSYLALHPTDTLYSVVRFQAPADGGYSVTALFKSLRTTGQASAEVYILSDFGGRSNYGYVDYAPITGQYTAGDAQATPIYEVFSLHAGDIVDFLVATDASTASGTDDIGMKLKIIDDDDFDFVEDSVDNCPTTENADQADANTDGTGDACTGARLVASNLSVVWDPGATNGHVAIAITTTKANGFTIGLAETADFVNGWFDENGFSTYVHNVPQNLTRNLTYVEAEADIVAGRKTLFDGDQATDAGTGADRLTYYVEMHGLALDTKCYVWGDYPAYYQNLGCTFFN
jgi:hypothetical protein